MQFFIPLNARSIITIEPWSRRSSSLTSKQARQFLVDLNDF